MSTPKITTIDTGSDDVTIVSAGSTSQEIATYLLDKLPVERVRTATTTHGMGWRITTEDAQTLGLLATTQAHKPTRTKRTTTTKEK